MTGRQIATSLLLIAAVAAAIGRYVIDWGVFCNWFSVAAGCGSGIMVTFVLFPLASYAQDKCSHTQEEIERSRE